jgi:hypothetical protein
MGSMVGVDLEAGSSALRFWLAAGSAMLLVAAGVLVLAQLQKKVLSSLVRSGIVVLGVAILATALAWTFLDYSRGRDRDVARQALEMRAEQLNGLALAPGSPLSCLDAMAGESVEAACEKALFATPATVAAAGSYVATELELLSDMVAYMEHGGADIDNVLLPLRRSLETDRFGFLAHVLAVRDGCTIQDCKVLALFRDPGHVRAHLSDAVYDHYLEQYQAAWAQAPASPVAPVGPVAEAAHPAEPSATAEAVPPTQRKVLVNIDFPTAASIPPISIMNPEPAGRAPPSAAAPASAANPNPSAAAEGSPRRPRKQLANAPGQAAAQSSPPAPDATQTQEDPVWLPASAQPPVTAAPQTATAAPPAAAPAPPAVAPAAQSAATSVPAPANFAAGAGAPVQLNPFASQR